MTRAWLLRLLAVLLVAGLVVLVVERTEWVDEEVERPARGAAADDPNYVLGRLVRGFGARFEHRRNLEVLPPPGATLLLESGLWDLFPDRPARLRRWVEAGGHLVVPVDEVEGRWLRAWVPMSTRDPARRRGAASSPQAGSAPAAADDEADDDDVPASPWPEGTPPPGAASQPASMPAAVARRMRLERCLDYAEPAGTPPALPGRHAYHLCHRAYTSAIHATRGAVPSWSLRVQGQAIAMRVDVGRGSVTTTDLLSVESNEGLVKNDNAAFLAALLQLRPGHEVWDVDDESQPVLAVWLWQNGRPALVLAALAITAWLWRRAVRFGPRIAAPEAARRAIGDQVAGVAAFLRHREPEALQRAARRALEQLARRHLAGFDAADETSRARAIADAARLDAAPLLAAMRPGPLATPAQWLAATATLESTRRALRDALRPARPGAP